MPLRWLLATGLLVSSLVAAPASSQIYRCRDAQGKTLFTSDPSQCPGARAHELRGQVQSVPSARPTGSGASRAPERPAASGLDEDAGRAVLWRQKKLNAQRELGALTRRLEHVRRAVGWCNRGQELYVEDESGIRRGYSCGAVRSEFEQLERAEAELRGYLAGGLEEECRRSGCLPGWIRD